MRKILTVCTGNICRSPLAQAMFMMAFREADGTYMDVSSAGLHALIGRDIDEDSKDAARMIGVELGAHHSRQFNAEIGREADIILVMEHHHRRDIQRRWPHLSGKTFLLGHFENSKEIPDPYKRGRSMHLHAAEMMQASVAHWVRQLRDMA
ncbi:MAG: low molecular weight protein-tyrosine-phosphatase [Roseovarius sp.]